MNIKDRLRSYIEKIKWWSLRNAVKRQGLNLYDNDISDQYTEMKIEKGSFLEYKLRSLHSFQVDLVLDILASKCFFKRKPLNLFDIGDSSGNHILLLKRFYKNLNTVSFNCDYKAIRKIKAKGLKAEMVRPDHNVNDWIRCAWLPKADVIMCFETMEHMTNLVSFIKNLKDVTNTFVFTVPYVRKSRIGFHHMKGKNAGSSPEDLHVHELSPKDYDIIFRHYGWKNKVGRIHWQYSKWNVLWPLLALFWYLIDYEGFYGAIYVRKD